MTKWAILCFLLCVGRQELAYSQGTPTEMLASLVRFRSLSGQEGEVGKFLLKYCQAQKLYTYVFTDKDYQFNFCASLYPLSLQKPNIILQSHIDVVPATAEDEWIYPPFAGKVDSVAVWGRGTVDCKGLLVMQLWALMAFIEKAQLEDLPYNVTLLVLSGEESGGKDGAKIIVENHLKTLKPVVVLGEGGAGLKNVVPSAPEKIIFGISVAEKSSLWLRVSARSKRNGHGSVPPKLYATKRLLRGLINLMNDKPKPKFSPTTRQMFRTLGKLEGGFNGFVIKHANTRFFRNMMRKHFEEGALFYPIIYNTITITDLANNRLGFNQISNVASAILDCRLLPETDIDKFLKKIKHKLGGLRGANLIEVEILDQSPHAPASVPDVFFKTMESALKMRYPAAEVVPILFPAGSDNNYFRAQGIPTFGILPALLTELEANSSHNINEHLRLESLQEGIMVYTIFLQKAMQAK